MSVEDDDGGTLRTAHAWPVPPSPASSGSRKLEIPGYQIKGRIGHGGMGTVYSAIDEITEEQVAIKVLEFLDDDALGRFRAEAAIMETLSHPGIAQVLASGDAEGRPYIVLEHIKGVTLDAFVMMMTPSLTDRLLLFAAICDAIEYAHGRGVVHRDLKPKNVMVRSDGTVAVLDFGIARSAASAGRTHTGDLLGTPLYMCPEQAMGKARSVDGRADVYSLGVILHELVAGKPPYDLRGMPLATAMKTILTQPPNKLDDPILDSICARALAKTPEERTASAAELATAVRGYITRT